MVRIFVTKVPSTMPLCTVAAFRESSHDGVALVRGSAEPAPYKSLSGSYFNRIIALGAINDERD
jgi:hypothetical protein